ncbi:hypothetical protein BGX23_003277, partial [Mortierella sp. AD031]
MAVPPPPGFPYSAITNRAGEVVTQREAITVVWSLYGQVGRENCYVAVRSFENPNLIVTGSHFQCASGAATLVIPDTPSNVSLKYDGTSLYMMCINSLFGTRADSEVFYLSNTKPSQPWGSTGDYIGLCAVVIAAVVGAFQIHAFGIKGGKGSKGSASPSNTRRDHQSKLQ